MFHLGDLEPEELDRLASGVHDTFVLVLPVPSIGSSNSHIDIADDLIEISWIAESISAVAGSVTAREDYDAARFRTRYLLSVANPTLGFGHVRAAA